MHKVIVWSLWRILFLVEYKQHQEPILKTKGTYIFDEDLVTRIALSPDGRTIALATGENVTFYSAITGNQEALLEGIHSGSSA